MAAVTVNSFKDNVPGSMRERAYNLDIANSGDTLAVGFPVKLVSTNDVAITKAAVTIASGASTVTFTTTGAVTGALVDVKG